MAEEKKKKTSELSAARPNKKERGVVGNREQKQRERLALPTMVQRPF